METAISSYALLHFSSGVFFIGGRLCLTNCSRAKSMSETSRRDSMLLSVRFIPELPLLDIGVVVLVCHCTEHLLTLIIEVCSHPIMHTSENITFLINKSLTVSV